MSMSIEELLRGENESSGGSGQGDMLSQIYAFMVDMKSDLKQDIQILDNKVYKETSFLLQQVNAITKSITSIETRLADLEDSVLVTGELSSEETSEDAANVPQGDNSGIDDSEKLENENNNINNNPTTPNTKYVTFRNSAFGLRGKLSQNFSRNVNNTSEEKGSPISDDSYVAVDELANEVDKMNLGNKARKHNDKTYLKSSEKDTGQLSAIKRNSVASRNDYRDPTYDDEFPSDSESDPDFIVQKQNTRDKFVYTENPSRRNSHEASSVFNALRNENTPNRKTRTANDNETSDDYNDISFQTVKGSLQQSRITNRNNSNSVYIQESVKYNWSMTHNSFEELRKLNDTFLDMKGKYKGVEIYLAKLVDPECITSIIDHYNNYLDNESSERMLRNRKVYYKYQWHDLPNDLIMNMIIEWVRPTNCSDFVDSIMDMLSEEIPQNYSITLKNFSNYFHPKILGLMDNIAKMREIFSSGALTKREKLNMPCDIWEEYNRDGYVKIFFSLLGKKHFKRVLNLCGGKSKIKEFKSLKLCFNHIRETLQSYRRACVSAAQFHSDMDPSQRVNTLLRDNEPNDPNNTAIVRYSPTKFNSSKNNMTRTPPDNKNNTRTVSKYDNKGNYTNKVTVTR